MTEPRDIESTPVGVFAHVPYTDGATCRGCCFNAAGFICMNDADVPDVHCRGNRGLQPVDEKARAYVIAVKLAR